MPISASVKFCEVFSAPPRYTQRMKRVIREVIKIVTTIHWLPEDGEQRPLTLDRIGLETEEKSSYTGGDNASDEITDSADQFSSYIYCTYILVYRVLDH